MRPTLPDVLVPLAVACLAVALGACKSEPALTVVVTADLSLNELEELRRGLALATHRDPDGRALGAAEVDALRRPGDGPALPFDPELPVEIVTADDAEDGQRLVERGARGGLVVAVGAQLQGAAQLCATLVPGRVAWLGAGPPPEGVLAAGHPADVAGYLAGVAAAGASTAHVIGVVSIPGEVDEELFDALQLGVVAFAPERAPRVLERSAFGAPESGAAAVGELAGEGADVIVVLGESAPARSAVLEAAGRGLPVVVDRPRWAATAGPSLAGQVPYHHGRFTYQLARLVGASELRAPPVAGLAAGWPGLEPGPRLPAPARERLDRIREELRTGKLDTDRAPAKVKEKAKMRPPPRVPKRRFNRVRRAPPEEAGDDDAHESEEEPRHRRREERRQGSGRD